MKNSNNSQ
jgi:hypothetical protein